MTDIFTNAYFKFLRSVVAEEPECQLFPDVFFPEGWAESEKAFKIAKEFCRRCPIQVECAMYAINNNEQHGVWGGLTPGDRQRARKRLNLVRKKATR